ncbi:unnamed protein product [Polarella glacialis]|uniref:Calmodulin n=1 Tax=Polarella glacialis TaxID=89957 RepID=A0A813JV16_POLGL|nr:unnamed protein product [Polarella glacialis]
MAKADLPEIMKYLGFAVASVDELKKISGKVNLLPDVDFNEFMAFVERFSQHEYDRYRKIFDEYDSEGTGDVVKTTELRKILSSIGFNVMRPAIEEALATFDIATADVTMSYEDFIQFLTVYMHTECFAKHQVMNMYNIFNGFTAHAADPRYLPATDLSECLVAAFGLPCQQHAVRIEQLVLRFRKSRSDGENGICFHEFMIFGRRLCEAEQADYRGAFVQFDKDNSGSISIDELSAALDCLGYRPMRSMLQEVLSEVDFESDEILDFEEFSHFMMLFKQRDGFLKKELDELKAVFCKFDCDRSDSIDVHELGDMLRFLGHSIATDDLHILVAEVDADRSGTLDVNEWLRLMRRHRESELKRLSDIFMHHAQGQAMMPSASITVAVQEAAPDPTLVPKVTRTLHKAIDFEDFVNLADRARALHVDAGRKMAGFSDIEIENFQEMFDGYDKDGNGTIDSVEVQALLGDFGIPCRTREEQQNMLELIATAKALCLEAEGRKSGETPKKGGPVPAIDVTFWELVQFCSTAEDPAGQRRRGDRYETHREAKVLAERDRRFPCDLQDSGTQCGSRFGGPREGLWEWKAHIVVGW